MRRVAGCNAEFVPNDEEFSPLPSAFSMMMPRLDAERRPYTFSELEEFRNAGFTHSELHQLPPQRITCYLRK